MKELSMLNCYFNMSINHGLFLLLMFTKFEFLFGFLFNVEQKLIALLLGRAGFEPAIGLYGLDL